MAEEEKDVNVEQVGAGLMLIDPNPSGRNVLPAEDMFIYVKFSAFNRNRSDLDCIIIVKVNDRTTYSLIIEYSLSTTFK